MDKIINWHDLSHYGFIVLRDEEYNIDLELNITLWEVEKVILESADFIYSIVIPKEMWEDGRFVFLKKT